MRNPIAALCCLVLVVAACGGDPATPSAGTSAATTVQTVATESTPASVAAPAQTTTPAAVPGVAALTSGRGDDGSLEVGIWLAADPFDGDLSVIVGTDSDDSYPGVGDPVPHIDGWLEIGVAGVSLLDDGAVVTDDAAADFPEWVSWTGPGRTFWIYFLQTVPVRAGTMWVVVEVGGTTTTGMVAGAPVGESCSYHGSGVDLGAVPGDVPQMTGPCRYPGF